ncbi:hypothetical protein ILYODFUR_026502 [Ilyodon furcidens]|uniref:Secreted protein n=1 Tax=Ilyodon furcidens TaxID=33524 RepID=A0ABV0U0T2_9TELE
MGLLAVCLFNVLLAQPVSLGGQPCLGSSYAIPCAKPLHNFLPDLSAVFLGLHDAACSLVNLRGQKQDSCIYTEIKLQTGGVITRLLIYFRWALFSGIRVKRAEDKCIPHFLDFYL